MTPRAAARPYAQALFEVMARDGAPARMAAQAGLSAVRDELVGHPDLHAALTSPAVPVPQKRAVVDAVLAKLPDVPDVVKRLVETMAAHDRLALLAPVAEQFEARVREEARVVTAEVVTAVPLSPDRQRAIAAALGRAVGREVEITPRTDPSIVGGVVARVGSMVFDGSITRQLEKLKAQLAEGAR